MYMCVISVDFSLFLWDFNFDLKLFRQVCIFCVSFYSIYQFFIVNITVNDWLFKLPSKQHFSYFRNENKFLAKKKCWKKICCCDRLERKNILDRSENLKSMDAFMNLEYDIINIWRTFLVLYFQCKTCREGSRFTGYRSPTYIWWII